MSDRRRIVGESVEMIVAVRQEEDGGFMRERRNMYEE